MRLEELQLVCEEAARNLAARGQRPLVPSVVLPLPQATRVLALEGWPDDDVTRTAVLQRFADDVMRPANASCFGFVAEAVDEEGLDIVVIVFGARRKPTLITAANLDGARLGRFADAEPLHPEALPFIDPLQQTVDAATPPDAFGGAG